MRNPAFFKVSIARSTAILFLYIPNATRFPVFAMSDSFASDVPSSGAPADVPARLVVERDITVELCFWEATRARVEIGHKDSQGHKYPGKSLTGT